MMPDRLQPVWHFHNPAQLTPGRTGKVKITTLRRKKPFPHTQLSQKPQIPTGLSGRRHLDGLAASTTKISSKLPKFRGSKLIFSGMGQHRKPAGRIDPLNDLLQLRPVSLNITCFSGAKVSLEGLSSILHDTRLNHHPRKMRSPGNILTGFCGRALQEVWNRKLTQALGDHGRPRPPIAVLPFQCIAKITVFDVKIETNDVYCMAPPQTGKFNTRNQNDTVGFCSVLCLHKALYRIVIREGEMGNLFIRGTNQ